MFGNFISETICNACKGKRVIPEKECSECRGRGFILKKEEIEIGIPAGIEDGSRLRVQGGGEYGRDGAGDLFIYINIKPHKTFHRQGRDIFYKLDIDMITASLGGEAEVPTLYGIKKIRIREGTETGERIILTEMGLPSPNSKRNGNEIAELFVKTPKKLSKEQKELLRKFAGKEKKKGIFGIFH